MFLRSGKSVVGIHLEEIHVPRLGGTVGRVVRIFHPVIDCAAGFCHSGPDERFGFLPARGGEDGAPRTRLALMAVTGGSGGRGKLYRRPVPPPKGWCRGKVFSSEATAGGVFCFFRGGSVCLSPPRGLSLLS